MPEPHDEEEDPGLGVWAGVMRGGAGGGVVGEGLPRGEQLAPGHQLVHGVLPGQGQHLARRRLNLALAIIYVCLYLMVLAPEIHVHHVVTGQVGGQQETLGTDIDTTICSTQTPPCGRGRSRGC